GGLRLAPETQPWPDAGRFQRGGCLTRYFRAGVNGGGGRSRRETAIGRVKGSRLENRLDLLLFLENWLDEGHVQARLVVLQRLLRDLFFRAAGEKGIEQ